MIRRGRARWLLLVVLAATPVAGCRSVGDPPAAPSAGAIASPTRAIERVPVRSYPLAARTAGTKPPTVVVRLAAEGEVSKSWPNSAFTGAAEGGAWMALGIAAVAVNPMAQAAAVGGIIALPGLTILGLSNSSHRTAVLEAIAAVDFRARLESALAAHVAASRAEVPAAAPGGAESTIEVVVGGFGFVGLGGFDALQFHCEAEIRVLEDGREVFREPVWWRAHLRSNGVPPPRSATLSEWADDDARLARETLVEAAEVLAAIAARSLGFRR